MNSLQVFCFESQEIRFVDGKPVANDVAKVLGYVDPVNTVRKKVSQENKGIAKMATPGGVQSVTVLEEAGIYQLVFSSKLESAKNFQQWVFSEVLPSIRKTGSFTIQHQIPKTYAEALLEAGRLALENEKLSIKIEQDAPLVSFAESVQASEDAIEFNEFAKAINTGRTRLFRLMRELGVIMKNTTLPYQRWIDAGYFEVSQEVTPDGRLRPFALITGKGQIWLKQKIDSHLGREQQMAGLIIQGVLGV